MELEAFFKKIEGQDLLSLCAELLLENLGSKTEKDISAFLNLNQFPDENKAFVNSLVASYQRGQISLEQLVKAFAKKNISVSL